MSLIESCHSCHSLQWHRNDRIQGAAYPPNARDRVTAIDKLPDKGTIVRKKEKREGSISTVHSLFFSLHDLEQLRANAIF
jgi:hypothetical protein